MEGATKVREEEATDLAKAEAEFDDVVDTLDRAIGIWEHDTAKNLAYAHIDIAGIIHNVVVCGISVVSVQVFSYLAEVQKRCFC